MNEEDLKRQKDFYLTKMLTRLMQTAAISTSRDVLNADMPDIYDHQIYTKKIKISAEVLNNVTIEYVSVSSEHRNFHDVSTRDIRFSFLNPQDKWCNLFATELTLQEIIVVYQKVKESITRTDRFLLEAKIEKCFEIIDDCSTMIDEKEHTGQTLDYTEYITEEEASALLTILNKIKARLTAS